jgi:transcriptional regulator with PAS, ATPase and Fis domain
MLRCKSAVRASLTFRRIPGRSWGMTLVNQHPWARELPVAVTVCDADGIVLEMNDRAAKTFQKQGGRRLVGTNLLDCHPEPARSKLQRLMDKRQVNVYSIEKNGIKKLIHQSPWYVDGRYAGFVEMSFEIPEVMPHFVRPSE